MRVIRARYVCHSFYIHFIAFKKIIAATCILLQPKLCLEVYQKNIDIIQHFTPLYRSSAHRY